MNEKISFIGYIADDVRLWDIQYRIHATRRMFQRSISEENLFEAMETGKIIESYEDDLPFPSILINGQTSSQRPIHIVIGVDKESKRLYIITTYEPDLSKWDDNFNRRI